MAFTVNDSRFPRNREFNTINEYREAIKKLEETEKLLTKKREEEAPVSVVATIVPAPQELIEQTLAKLESKIIELTRKIEEIQNSEPKKKEIEKNREGLSLGLTLRGESKGRDFTLEVIEGGYLCSDGNIYKSLSGAAEGVSGNRRSGWKFWKDIHGTDIGQVTGRFRRNEHERNSFSRTADVS